MKTTTAEALKQRIDSGEELNLLDVREADERAAFNIGGTHLPLGQILSMQVDGIDNLRDEEIIVYCRSGNRSGQACMFLETMGFKNVVNLAGGMLDYEAKFSGQ